MRYGLFIVTLVISFVLVRPGSANAEPRLDVHLSAQELLIGESVSLQVQLEWQRQSGDYRLEFPVLNLKNLSVLNRGKSQEIFKRFDEEWVRNTLLWELQAPALGESAIAPFEIRYLDPGTGEAGGLLVGEQRMMVRKPLWYLNGWLWAAAAFVGIIAVFAAYRRMNPPAIPEKVLPPVTPEEQCRQLLKEIDDYGGVAVPRNLIEDLDRQFQDYLKDVCIEEGDNTPLRSISNRFRHAKYSGVALTRNDYLGLKKELMHYVDGKRVVEALMQEEEKV